MLRGDKCKIKVGHKTNIQDRAVISSVSSLETGFPPDVEIGDEVTIGHGALLTSCTIGDRTLIGQGSVIGEGCDVGINCIIAAGAVLPPHTVVSEGQMWAGNPAKYIRDVTDEEKTFIEKVNIVVVILATNLCIFSDS